VSIAFIKFRHRKRRALPAAILLILRKGHPEPLQSRNGRHAANIVIFLKIQTLISTQRGVIQIKIHTSNKVAWRTICPFQLFQRSIALQKYEIGLRCAIGGVI